MKKLSSIKSMLLLSSFALFMSTSSQAEVSEQTKTSFTVKHSFISKKSVSLAKHQFGHAGWWWTSEFTQSGKGNNMFFNGEGLHERMPDGTTITHLSKVKRGEWTGALGKLRNKDVDARMKVSIKEVHGRTKVLMEYTVTSDQLSKNDTWPSYTDSMLYAQMNSLKVSLDKR